MRDVLYQFYIHYGLWTMLVPMLALAVSERDIGKILAQLETLLNMVRGLDERSQQTAIKQGEMQETLGVLCSQQTEMGKAVADHEVRLRKHTGILGPLVVKVDEHEKVIGEIKAVVLSPKGKAAEGGEEGDETRVSLPRWLIVLGAAAAAAGGATLLEFIKTLLTGKP